MADRIFPSAEKDSLGSAKQINTIDWDAFAKSFRTAAEDEKPEAEEVEEVDVKTMTDGALESAIKDSDEYKKKSKEVNFRNFCEKCPEKADCKPHCEEWLERNPEEDEEDEQDEESNEDDAEASYGKMAKAAKKHPSPFIQKKIDEQKKKGPDTDGVDTKNMPSGLKKYHEDKKASKPEDSKDVNSKAVMCEKCSGKGCKSCDKVVRAKEVMCEKCAGKGCKACWDKKMASSEGRVIVFNHPNEISAEALMSAKTAGDDVKVRAILAAREQRNRVIEAKLESLAQDEANKTEKLAARRNYRANIIAEAEKAATRLASADAVVTKKSEKEGFKSVTSMKNDEKVIVAQRLLDNGFPKEYVEATLGLNMTKATISTEEVQIREVMSSSLNDTTKRTAVAGLVKVAKLSDEQLERCIRFWVDELGYGDEQWVRDLFTSKY